MNRVRAMIAEDEELARSSLRRLIALTDWVELIGEAADGLSAVAAIDRLRPDLLFLDVVLPELSGVEVLRRVHHHPLVVFTTAYERFAVTAFELEALDYLVKPFAGRRFHETMERVRRRFESEEGPTATEQLRGTLGGGPLERLFARVGSRIVPIAIRDVIHFQAEGDYVRAFEAGASHLLNVTLGELAERLEKPFLRVHRSHIVNVDCVETIERHDERRLVIVLGNGHRVVASRSGSAELRKVMR